MPPQPPIAASDPPDPATRLLDPSSTTGAGGEPRPGQAAAGLAAMALGGAGVAVATRRREGDQQTPGTSNRDEPASGEHVDDAEPRPDAPVSTPRQPGISILTLDGEDIDTFPDEFPFKVEVVTEPPQEGESVPPSITIELEGGDDSEELTLRWTGNIVGPPVYTSGPISVEAGGESSFVDTWMGFGYSSGSDMDSMSVPSGGHLALSFGGYTTEAQIFDSWHDYAIDQLQRFFTTTDRYWRTLRIRLEGVPGDEAAAMRTLADQKLALIADGRSSLHNEHYWPGQRVAVGELYARRVQASGLLDTRGLSSLVTATLRTARREAEDRLLDAVAELVFGAYHMFTHATSAAQLYAAFTGTDIMGQTISDDERVLAALDVAANVAAEALGVAWTRHSITQARNARRGVELDLTPTHRVDPENVDARIAVDPASFGLRPEAVRQARRVADRHGVVIEIRPANLESMPWQALGHPPKPMDIKAKTINEIDVQLGADPDTVGLVGYFEPRLPPNPTPEVTKRYNDRLTEHRELGPKMESMQAEGRIRLENGLVIDTGLVNGSGLAITGDYDLWAIRSRDGTALTAEQADAVLADLSTGEFQAQHGAHTWWIPKNPFEQEIDAAIRGRHMEGGEALVTIGGRADGPARTTFSDIDPVTPQPRGREFDVGGREASIDIDPRNAARLNQGLRAAGAGQEATPGAEGGGDD